MKQTITLLGKPIEYVLKRSDRARSIRLSITPEGELSMTVPSRGNVSMGESFMKTKAPWILKKLKYWKLHESVAIKVKRGDIVELKRSARELVVDRLKYFNQFYGFRYNKITIRNQKSRWGSCSKQGNLNFSYKIATLPAHLSDYIIVHELCHLGELNHSKNFWNLVEKVMPDWKRYKKELGKVRIVFQ